MDEGITTIEPEPYPEEWLARIKPETAPGERHLGAGEAIPKRETSGRFVASPSAVAFLAVSLFGFAALLGHLGERFRAIEAGMATLGVGSGVLASLVGVGIVSAWLTKRHEGRPQSRSLYALTDERASTWIPSRGKIAILSTPKQAIKKTQREEFADGSGTLFLNVSGLGPVLHDIAEVRCVEDLVLRVLLVPHTESLPSERS